MVALKYMYKICDHIRRKIPYIFKKTDSFFTGIAATNLLQTESCINFINIFIKQNIADDIMRSQHLQNIAKLCCEHMDDR
jgi:hypothetical protein